MAGRIDIWKDDDRKMPSYEVRYFNSKGNLKEVYRASVFDWSNLYGVGTIHFGKKDIILEFHEASTDILSAQKKAYEDAKNFAYKLALDYKVKKVDDATVFKALDEMTSKRNRKP